jgi:programmed cell death 6-interacting protein
MHETSKLKANDIAIYQEGVDLLRSEAAEDDRAKLKHGTDRWNRQPSQQAAEKLYAQVTEIDGYLKSASSSDDLVKAKLKDCEKVLQVLSGSDRDLEEFVPSSRRATMTSNVERAAHNLRNMLNEVSRLEARRKRQIEKVRDKAKRDDISMCSILVNIQSTDLLADEVILAEAARLERDMPMQKIEPANFETLFEERLERYDEDRKLITVENEEQDQLSAQLKEVNTAFANARKGDSSTRDREQALQRLENAYLKYKEIVNNLNTGRKFYNDLANIVTRFRDGCKTFAYQRRVEAGQLESDLSNAMSALNLSQVTSLQDQKQRETLRSQYSTKAPSSEPLTAPTPTRAAVQPPPPTAPTPGMWNPEMGIKFGGALAQQPSGDVHNPTYPSAKLRGGQWDMNQGVRFG